MNLFYTYLLLGVVFGIISLLFFVGGDKFSLSLNKLPRSAGWGNVLWAGALAWFFYHIMTIGEVDLAGFPRSWFIVLFGGAGILAFYFLKNWFPFARGLSILILFLCNEFLKIGFNQLPYSLVLSVTSYLLIISALWMGASPYIFRDFVEWATKARNQKIIVGILFAILAIAQLIMLFFVKNV